MEWEAPGIVLSAQPFGEADAVCALFTEAQGRHPGLVRGGAGRRGGAVWQPGNLVQARWTGRLAEQLGTLSGELVHPAAALALDDPLGLAVLCAMCAVADGALPEREPQVAVFSGLLALIARLAEPVAVLADLVRWEMLLLGALGYGLDLSRCAVSGAAVDLGFVSPRSGRAVARQAAGEWQGRLLPLPGFLVGGNETDLPAIEAGLRLTGHFLARDAFGSHHRPLPLARVALYDRVQRMAGAGEDQAWRTGRARPGI